MFKLHISFLLFFIVPGNLHAQDPEVSFIIATSPRSYVKDSDITFPVFRFMDKEFSKKVNGSVVKKFKRIYHLEDSTNNIKALLDRMAEDGLASLEYTLLRNDKLFFAFYLGSVWEAAYSTYFESYYCFDRSTGNLLTIDSLIAPEKKWSFLNTTRGMQKKRMNKYKAGLSQDLKDKGIDKGEYDHAMTLVQNDCWENYIPGNFKLSKDKLEIIINCEFPHAALAISPSPVLQVSLNFLRQYVKPKYKGL